MYMCVPLLSLYPSWLDKAGSEEEVRPLLRVTTPPPLPFPHTHIHTHTPHHPPPLTTHPQLRAISTTGQSIMQKLEDSGKPVIAAIHGSCLGGGLEVMDMYMCMGRKCTSRVLTPLTSYFLLSLTAVLSPSSILSLPSSLTPSLPPSLPPFLPHSLPPSLLPLSLPPSRWPWAVTTGLPSRTPRQSSVYQK